jgi:hypothetical protein
VSAKLEAAWHDVIANIGPEAIPALVAVLDRYRALDEIKQRAFREAAKEMRDSAHAPDTQSRATRWLRHQLADGERRVQQLKVDAARDGVSWRSCERVKRSAGAVAARRGNAWSWSLATPPRPPAHAERIGTIDGR